MVSRVDHVSCGFGGSVSALNIPPGFKGTVVAHDGRSGRPPARSRENKMNSALEEIHTREKYGEPETKGIFIGDEWRAD